MSLPYQYDMQTSMRTLLFTILLFYATTFSFAQEKTYTLAYLEKAKCKHCGLKLYNYTGDITQIRTYRMEKTGKDTFYVWHGYDVIYYETNKPKRVSELYKEVKHGDNVEFYRNGKIQVKGTFKKNLKHGKWISYDSLGNFKKSVTYKNGNDVASNVKYYYYFGYGLRAFRDESYDRCRDSIQETYFIKKHPIAGCTIDNYALRLAERHNRKVDRRMLRMHGALWEERMKADIEKCCAHH